MCNMALSSWLKVRTRRVGVTGEAVLEGPRAKEIDMSDTWIIIGGAAVAATYFLASVVVGVDRHGTAAQRLRDALTTAVIYTVYSLVAVALCNALPGPLTMLGVIALLSAVTGTYAYYRIRRDRRNGTSHI
ncbi:hypothetical protein JPH1_54170 (plasmid) [Mycobacterium avium subsp. hominissuis]|uniref:Transmembrane protein n=2 Tax=Mycobacterium avium TaxID=1764 RepID=A0AAI8X5H5_MYCAV|nr:hypothetical protein JPH1_54170 [Mycobacterium avium subsp. hominissuis]